LGHLSAKTSIHLQHCQSLSASFLVSGERGTFHRPSFSAMANSLEYLLRRPNRLLNGDSQRAGTRQPSERSPPPPTCPALDASEIRIRLAGNIQRRATSVRMISPAEERKQADQRLEVVIVLRRSSAMRGASSLKAANTSFSRGSSIDDRFLSLSTMEMKGAHTRLGLQWI